VLQQLLANRRLPALIVSLGVGILLIAGGVSASTRQERGVQVAVAGTQTAFAPTATATLTATPSDTPTPTDTPTNTPTGTLPPTFTPTVTLTPSPTPVPPHPSKLSGTDFPTPSTPPPTGIPTAAEAIDVPSGVVNILLLGSDKREDDSGYRTDTIIVVSINRTEGTVNMLSLPRDLYVYIPGWTMNRINTADGRGSAVGWPGGGPGLIKDTLLYNFGIVIHYYARVDFSSFQNIVNAIGGVDVPVDCAIQGWVLKPPRKQRGDFTSFSDWANYTDPTSNNWEPFTLPVGVQHLDGYLALWYARIRHGVAPNQSYDDTDRARRQQQVLRAIFNKSRSVGLLPRVPELWQNYSDLVQTDMGLGNILQMVPIATDLDSSKITSFIITRDLMIPWTVPTDGSAVDLPNPDGVPHLISLAMQPPAQNYVVANSVKVEVRNGTSTDRLDEVAADRLLRQGGMNVIATGFADHKNYAQTMIYDYTGGKKSGHMLDLQHVLHVADEQVVVQPDPNRSFDYLVILGEDYLSHSCTYNVPPPVDLSAIGTPGPTLAPEP
jgi:LCP family protein required for cell wall assembly